MADERKNEERDQRPEGGRTDGEAPTVPDREGTYEKQGDQWVRTERTGRDD